MLGTTKPLSSANAGTQETLTVRMGFWFATNALEYWVPAFAGTTAESHCLTSRGRTE
jgi:hypothetical protein